MSSGLIKKNDVLVSVVMPTYNCGEFLRESLESLISQKFKAFEVIVVNDGSTDDTAEILLNYSKKDSRIITLQTKNSGAASARNYGLLLARGKYVIFLDSDDIFQPELFARCYEDAEKTQADITIFKYTIWFMKDGKMLTGRGVRESKSRSSADLLKLSVTNPEAWNKFYRKDFLLNNNLKFQSLNTCNDVMFTKSSLVCAKKISYLDDDLLIYRVSDKNTSSTRYHHALNIIEAGNSILSFVNEKDAPLDYDDFYRMMLSFINHEFKYFPANVDKARFIDESFGFFPNKYWRKMKLKMVRVSVSRLSIKTLKSFIWDMKTILKH